MASSWLMLLATLAACEVAELPGGQADARDTRDTRDGASDSAPEADSGLVACDPFGADSGCAGGQYCEVTARVCVDCVGFVQRCVGSPERARRETCQAPVASGEGQVEGGFWESDPCPSGHVCTSAGTPGAPVSCLEQVCEPGFSTCKDLKQSTCNPIGTAVVEDTCGAGEACYSGQCDQIRHNVLVIFDTSASMWSYLEPGWNQEYTPLVCEGNPYPCFSDFPVCDDRIAPSSLFTLSKNVFTSVVEDTIGNFSQFALQRFPQRDTPGANPSCSDGWYAAQEEMSGDDDQRSTEGGTWFEDNLGQVLVVPFPVRNTIDNIPEILGWMDHDERLGASPDSCTTAADCGADGRCGDYNGQKRCLYHTDPELRAISQTPLGKSLFYAGEYIRRFVRVDGKACTSDASCDSAGYVCRGGACIDPYRKCKDDYIVLFTDGGESFFQSEADFFNPVVQAKRLAFGLDCDGDADCRGEATCQSGKCLGKEQRDGDTPTVDGLGFGALSSPDGTPISIKTTVITLNAAPSINARIAYAGGGANLDVSGGDPETFRRVLLSAMTPNYKCRPEEIPPRDE